LANNSWIQRGWTNNNAESYNHVLKNKTNWKQMKTVNALVSAVADLVQLQMKDLQRALHGAGNFILTGPFARHHVSYQCWVSMSDDRRTAAFRRFLSDTGNRQPPVHVQASDGGLTVLNATKVARKPGQRKRPRAARTTSKKAA